MPISVLNMIPTVNGNQIVNGNQTINGTLTLQQILENTTVSNSSASGTINYYLLNQDILYFTAPATANWTLNITGNSTTTLNSMMSTGQTTTLVFLVSNGATAYYQTGLQIDGNSITPNWFNKTPVTSGHPNAIDAYSITITKTANATYTVLETQTTFG
jgi:hypothetical protein